MKRLLLVISVVVLLAACAPAQPKEEASSNLSLWPPITSLQEGNVPTRPEWPGRLDVSDLKTGDFIFQVGKDYKYEVLITKAPYTDENGKCGFDIVYWQDNAPMDFIDNEFCSDFGLLEYNGFLTGWNPFNHLIKSDRASLSQAKVNEIVKKIQDSYPKLPAPYKELIG